MSSKQPSLSAGQAVTVDVLGNVNESRQGSVVSFEENAVVACIGTAIPVNSPVSIKSNSLLLLGEVCATRLHAGEFQILVLVEQYVVLACPEREAPPVLRNQEALAAHPDPTGDSLYSLIRNLIGEAPRQPALSKVAKA